MTVCSSLTLNDVRRHIDRLDSAMVALLIERSHYVREAARFKKTQADIVIPGRIEEIVRNARHQAKALGGDPDFVEKMYRTMLDVYIWHERKAWSALYGTE